MKPGKPGDMELKELLPGKPGNMELKELQLQVNEETMEVKKLGEGGRQLLY